MAKTKEELKQWFLNDCDEMLKLWIEAEKTFAGTNVLSQEVINLGNRRQEDWATLERDTGFPVGDAWKARLMHEIPLSGYTPQDFDAGTAAFTQHDPRGKFFRYVHFDGQWYTCCVALGTKSLREILELHDRRTYTDEQVNPYHLIRHVWRFNSEA